VDEGKVRLKELITHRLRLEEAPQFFARALDGEIKPLKVMISP
jgi:threonine dehydrogenase-like Zn-dependent dehydrogenase